MADKGQKRKSESSQSLEERRKEGGWIDQPGIKALFVGKSSPCNFWSTENWRHLKPLSPKDKQTLSTNLGFAIVTENADAVLESIQSGADVNGVLMNHGETALHQSVFSQNMEITELLLRNGASPNLGMDGGDTPLHYACQNDDIKLEMFELLLYWGADPCAKNEEGKMPIEMTSSDERKALLQKWMDLRASKVSLLSTK